MSFVVFLKIKYKGRKLGKNDTNCFIFLANKITNWIIDTKESY